MNSKNFSLTFMRILPVVVLALSALATAGELVDHPDKLTYPEQTYTPPKAADYRHTLDCGATVFIAENHMVPTFEMTVLVRTGSLYVPPEKAGLAGITGYMMRNGGVEGMTAGELDERLAFLAGSISVSIGEDSGRASLFCLVKDMDEGLGMLRKILEKPLFEQKELDRHRGDILSELAQRNASTSAIENREWTFLLYGDHPSTTRARRTGASVGSITREDLIAFHRTYFFPGNFTIAVSGDFETGAVLEKLNTLFADWPNRELELPAIPDKISGPKPGVYMVKKEDVNQSRIRVGHIGVKRDIPDEFALMVMNDILGGGGFTSRIVRRVRSDEGLAYSTGSRFGRPVLYPGTFQAWFQTKHATAAFGTRLIVDEIKRIREEKVEEETIEISRQSLIGGLTRPFSSRNSMVSTFANDHYTGRPDGYWQTYEKKVKAVGADEVLAAAKTYLHPDKLVFLVVGDPEAVERGSDKHPEKYSDFGPVTMLPLRDPLTLE